MTITVTSPMGTVQHDDAEAAIEFFRVSIENGFPATIEFRPRDESNCTGRRHASGPSGTCDCGV